jgi:hypothetical protein
MGKRGSQSLCQNVCDDKNKEGDISEDDDYDDHSNGKYDDSYVDDGLSLDYVCV